MGERVLVVDCNGEVLDRLSTFLGGEGFEVATARSGEEASRVLRAGPCQFLMVDAGSPGVDEEGFLEVVRGLELRPRVIAFVSPPSGVNFERAMRLGADACLAKPLDEEALRYTVRELQAER